MLACLGASVARAQMTPRHFEHIRTLDGLSQSTVQAIAQDRFGFLWLGTQDGLNRYDGYSFTVLRHDGDSEAGTLTNSHVTALLADDADRLWVGTRAGLSQLGLSGGPGRLWTQGDLEQGLGLSGEITSLAQGADGTVWVGTKRGLAQLTPDSDRLIRFSRSGWPADWPDLADASIYSLSADSNGELWVGTMNAGVCKVGGTADRCFRHDPDEPGSLSADGIWAIHEDRSRRLWIAAFDGTLNLFDRAGETFVRHSLPSPGTDQTLHPRSLVDDASGRLWIATDRGLLEWDAHSGSGRFHRHESTAQDSLSHDFVISVLIDRGGILWAGTMNGLNKINTATDLFRRYRKAPGDAGLSHDTVTSFAVDPESIWIGTLGGGLNRLDRKTGAFDRPARRQGGSALSDDRVTALLAEGATDLWVGTFEGGLNRLDRTTGKVDVERHDPDRDTSLSANGVTRIYRDRSGSLWIGTFGGGLNRRLSSNRFQRFLPTGDPGSIHDSFIWSLYETSDGVLWIGSAGQGLAFMDGDRDAFHRLEIESAEQNEIDLESGAVYSFYEDDRGNLWIGTDSGLVQVARDRTDAPALARRYTRANGLSNDTVYGILQSDRGRLWISTNDGISRFDPRTGEMTRYDVSHGLQSNEFNLGAYHATDEGELLFGGMNGFNLFDPLGIGRNEHRPPVVLTGFSRLNEPAPLEAPIWATDEVEVGHRDYVVTFEFAALDFTDPSRNTYQYMLEGLDPSWVDLGTDRRVTYSGLAGGRYEFRVRGANNDGIWSDEEARLSVLVHSPPWKTTGAYLLYATLAALILGLILRSQHQKLKREARYNTALRVEVADRTRELARTNEELMSLNDRLARTAMTDPLTGLFNRHYLSAELEHELSRVDAADRRHLFMMVDLDRLKSINDTYGHEAGDRAIVRMAETLQETCRAGDSIVRWGGDEFLIVARDVDMPTARKIAGRICEQVSSTGVELDSGVSLESSCSLGMALFPFHESADGERKQHEALAIADRALYVAKISGRNAWVGLEATPTTPTSRLVEELNDNLEGLVANGRIKMHTSFETGLRLEKGA